MTVTIDIVDQDVYTALRSFLLSVLPINTPVIQGIVNKVSMPAGGFVSMTSKGQERIATNINTTDSANQITKVNTPMTYSMQLDFYGAGSQSWAIQFQALFRDEFATRSMPKNITPLYSDDPMQMPLINGEEQYEQRWKVSAKMQYSPIITIPQQSATQLNVGIIEIDTTYTP
jgi:hypothetical protein